LHGFPANSQEAKNAQDQLTQAQQAARTATDQLATAQRGLITAINQTQDASLALKRAQADVAGQLTSTGGSASKAASAMQTYASKLATVKTAIENVAKADRAAAADAAAHASQGPFKIFASGVIAEINALRAAAAAEPALAHAFDSAIASLLGVYNSNAQASGGAVATIQQLQNSSIGGYGHKAGGGPVSANRAYIIGEQGPELFIPRSSGDIVPHSSLKNSRPLGGGVVNNWTVNSYSLDPKGAEQAILKVLRDHSSKNGSISGVRVSG
jgi:hypothetical protein